MPPPTLFEEATGFTIDAELIEYVENNVHLPTQLLKSNGDYTSTGDERAPTDEEAHTRAGNYELFEWKGFYDVVYYDFNTPQLLSELLKNGANINYQWRRSGGAAARFMPLQQLMLYGGEWRGLIFAAGGLGK
ncbi:hypothetical protein DDE82_000862 [Stemphylium lycopersici]|nr:hypothetical protein TW65_05911 [Stemphylium lycopersici]RAR10891.1 hypothetical protein DDE82_000862 [Stemphylium lycopersici]